MPRCSQCGISLPFVDARALWRDGKRVCESCAGVGGLCETIEIDKNAASCYQYAIKTMQRLGAVPVARNPSKAFEFRFVETSQTGTISIDQAGAGSNVTIRLMGLRSVPEPGVNFPDPRSLMKRIIVEMNPPELVMRHEGIVIKVDAQGFLLELPPCRNCNAPLSLSQDRTIAKCAHCGSTYPTIQQVR